MPSATTTSNGSSVFRPLPRWVAPAVLALVVLIPLLEALVIEPLVRAALVGASGLAPLDQWAQKRAHGADKLFHNLDRVVLGACFFLVFLYATLRASRSRRFFRRYIGVAPAWEIGAYRCVAALLAFVQLASESLPNIAQVPISVRLPVGLMHAVYKLPGTGLLRDAAFLAALQAVTLVCLALAMVGYKTRFSVAASTVLLALCGGLLRDYTHYFHSGLLALYFLAVLSFCRSGDGFSIDALRADAATRARTRTKSQMVAYGMARYMLWVLLSFPYVLAGLSKVRAGSGFGWAAPDNVRRMLFSDSLNVDFIHLGIVDVIYGAPDWFFLAIGVSTLVFEVGFCVVLFHRFGRVVAPLLMASMHVGILVIQGFTFFDCLAFDLVWVVLGVLGTFPGYRAWPRRVHQLRTSIVRRLEAFREGRSQGPGVAVGASAGGLRNILTLQRLAVAVVPFQLLAWAAHLDHYPVSEWAMYASASDRTTSQFYRVRAVRSDGKVVTDVFTRCLPIYERDARYRDLLWRAFRPAKVASYEEWVDACVRAYETLPEVQPHHIATLELQHFEWNFREAPAQPQAAEVVETHRRDFDHLEQQRAARQE